MVKKVFITVKEKGSLAYCYEFANIECKFGNINCFCIIISQTYLKYTFSEKNCEILAKFSHEIRPLRFHCKFNAWTSLATFLATIWKTWRHVLTKNKYSRNF